MGEINVTAFCMRVCLIRVSESPPNWRRGATALATGVATWETKNEKNIQRAMGARVEVAMVRNTMEKSIDIPNQKDT